MKYICEMIHVSAVKNTNFCLQIEHNKLVELNVERPMIQTMNIATIRAVYVPFDKQTNEQSMRRGYHLHVRERIRIGSEDHHTMLPLGVSAQTSSPEL